MKTKTELETKVVQAQANLDAKKVASSQDYKDLGNAIRELNNQDKKQ